MTITKYHIELYKKIGGDVDHLQRIGTPEEKTIDNQNIIFEMKELISNLELVKNGTTSRKYTEKIESKLINICADDIIITEMKKLQQLYV